MLNRGEGDEDETGGYYNFDGGYVKPESLGGRSFNKPKEYSNDPSQ